MSINTKQILHVKTGNTHEYLQCIPIQAIPINTYNTNNTCTYIHTPPYTPIQIRVNTCNTCNTCQYIQYMQYTTILAIHINTNNTCTYMQWQCKQYMSLHLNKNQSKYTRIRAIHTNTCNNTHVL